MWINDAQLVLPDRVLERGSLQIAEGRISEIIEGPPPAHTEHPVDGRRLIVMPGIIDMHGDMLEREIEPRPQTHFPYDMALFELDKRLAGAGVTTAYAALSFFETDKEDSVRSREIVTAVTHTLNRLRSSLLVDMLVHARFEVSTPSVAPLVLELLETNQVQLLSLMDHTPGQGQYRDIEHYITFIAKWRKVDRAFVEAEVRERLARIGDPRDNWEIARDVVSIARERGLPIASHDDDTLEKVDLVASLGTTICEFPVTLEAAQEARRRGMHVVMGAPNVLRGTSHSGNLSARTAIAEGVVDLLAADYYPAALLHAVFTIVEQGLLPLHEAAALVSRNVADALGLYGRGRIAVGAHADLVLVEAAPRARVRGTIRNGIPIYWDNQMYARTRAFG